MTRGIRKQQIRNERSLRLVSNRFQVFMVQWSFEDELFLLIYICATLLLNLRITKSVNPMAPMERMLERIVLYKRYRLFIKFT